MLMKYLKNEQGTSLIELIIAIILMGVALPSILGMMGLLSVQSARQSVMQNIIALAETKIEEITGRKEADWIWYRNPSQFETDESLPDGYHRSVSVTPLNSWGNASVQAWEVKVTVTHELVPDGYSLTVRFTKYY